MIALFDSANGDTRQLAELHTACFSDAWSARAIADLLVTPNCFAFASEQGFILARAVGAEAEILTLAVAPAARRRGVGQALVTSAAAHARNLASAVMFLEVRAGNRAAIALYRRLGFLQVAVRKGYYDGEDALVLKAALPLSRRQDIA
ncbi:MAG TPA: ribosomal protein S18-alanine N-acetyltransferase [Rhizomicrobium sp.]|jgi:ribosomal-protein-alanine N-acetyltransferase|nr:ribosomal protein S18-alanine N-acetyltransferase [Rhizomicrobium sp.]